MMAMGAITTIKGIDRRQREGGPGGRLLATDPLQFFDFADLYIRDEPMPEHPDKFHVGE